MVTVNEVLNAVQAARDTQRAADRAASGMAQLLVGRLRHIGYAEAAALKKELRKFNIHTFSWKE